MTFEERIAALRQRESSGTVSGFRFRRFSQKQKTLLTWWHGAESSFDGVIADGAVRSGKTVAMSLGFVLWAMNSFSGQSFAICGKTLGSVERNILCWLRQMLQGRGYKFTEKRSEHLMTVSRGNVYNRFYCFGGRDASSQDLIQGMTLAGVLFDEVALMPESFVSQATARCSVEGSKWWFNCNPEGPYHWFKRGWIDSCDERNLLYLHFTMDDNLSLTKEIRRRYERMYSGTFYHRYILGRWCVAEGLVYPMFERGTHVTAEHRSERFFLSCDYGTQNPFALGLIGVWQDEEGTHYHLAAELYHDGRLSGQLTDGQYADRLEQFAAGTPAAQVVVDPSASSFIAELRRRGWQVIKARNDVTEGLRCVAAALSEQRLTIDPSCEDTLREFASYAWDDAACAKGEDKPLKRCDHAMDMLRYALMTDGRLTAARAPVISGKGRR